MHATRSIDSVTRVRNTHYATTAPGQKLQVIFGPKHPTEIFVLNKGGQWQAVPFHYVPKELRRSPEEVVALLKVATFSTSLLSNCEYNITIGFGGLKGGMFTSAVATRQNARNIVQQQQGMASVVAQIDRRLANVPIQRIGSVSAALKIGGATALGFALGTIVPIIGNIVGALVGYFLSKKSVEAQRREADLITREIETIVSVYYEVQALTSEENTLGAAAKTRELITYLETHNYINRLSSNSFSFKEDKFNKIGSFYESTQQNNLKATVKLLVLSTLYAVPKSDRPVEPIHDQLRQVIGKLTEATLIHYANAILGRFLQDREYYREAKEAWETIPDTCSLYQAAQDFIRIVDEIMEERQEELE